MSNALTEYIEHAFFSERYIMDLLDEQGIISNHCVTPEDVCESDAVKAVEYLKSLK